MTPRQIKVCFAILVLVTTITFCSTKILGRTPLKNTGTRYGHSAGMQRYPVDTEWNDLFDHEISNLETRLVTESGEMIKYIFGETENGNSGNKHAQNDLNDLIIQLQQLRSNMSAMSTKHLVLEGRFASALRERSDALNMESLERDLGEMSKTLADLSAAVESTANRTDSLSGKDTPRTTAPADCAAIQQCNGNYGNGEYFVYPASLGGQKVKVYCHNMGDSNPSAYITLHRDNIAAYNYSLRPSQYDCNFQDRVGDATAHFSKIRVNLEDMTIVRDDYTFAAVVEEDPGQWILPKFGGGGGCSWDYMWRRDHTCIAPGGFVIDTSGTGLIIDPQMEWTKFGYGARRDEIVRSNENFRVTGACDGWCGYCWPIGEITLHLVPGAELEGDTITQACT